jgi:hypothetical protein
MGIAVKTLTSVLESKPERDELTPADRLAADFGWNLPQHVWTGFKPLADINEKVVKKEPSPRTRQRAMKRAKDLDADLAKEKARIDGTGRAFRLRFRGGSRHIVPPSNDTDICHRTRIWNKVEEIERRSYARRGRYQRNGQFGKVATELMRTILFRLNKSDGGKVYPTYEVLAELTQYCQRAIINAMGKLVTLGFITLHRRCKWMETRYGRRLVQDSNAYEYHLPKTGLGMLVMAVFAPDRSDCTGIREDSLTDSASIPQQTTVGTRFWLIEPQPLGDGGYW